MNSAHIYYCTFLPIVRTLGAMGFPIYVSDKVINPLAFIITSFPHHLLRIVSEFLKSTSLK